MAMPTKIADFEILDILGKGGMGVVYLARQKSLNREIALKVLAEEYSDHPNYVQRFYREARAVAGITHNNIVQIYSIGSERNYHYFAMEYVRGKTLQRKMKDEEISLEQGLQIIIEVVQALKAAHTSGIIHRDIKPGNIMISNSGVAKVMDFGLVKVLDSKTMLTDTGLILGTANYMSPEQCLGEVLDGRTDIYSLGIVFYELATGKLPFSGRKATDVIHQQLYKIPDPPMTLNSEVTSSMDAIILKMLEKKRDERYENAGTLLNDLLNLKHIMFAKKMDGINHTGSHHYSDNTYDTDLAVLVQETTRSTDSHEIARISVGGLELEDDDEPAAPLVAKAQKEAVRDEPVTEEIEVAKQPEKEAVVIEAVNRATPLVLVADDVSYSRLLYKTVLVEMGVSVIQARDGLEALKMIKQHKPNVCILDIGMPRMSGLDVLNVMSRLKHNIKFVVITAHKDKETVFQAARKGVIAYLTKPVKIDDLRQRVAEVINTEYVPLETGSKKKESKTRKVVEKKKIEVKPVTPNPTNKNKPLIIICDQHPSTQELYKAVLQPIGEVVIMETAGGVVRLVKQTNPAVIIIDGELEDDGASKLVSALRDVRVKQIPIIIVEQSVQNHWYSQRQQFNIDDIIKKPIKINELKLSIKRILKIDDTWQMKSIKDQLNDSQMLKTIITKQHKEESSYDLSRFALSLVDNATANEKKRFKERLEANDEASNRQIIANILARKKEKERISKLFEAFKNGNFKLRYICLDLIHRFIGEDQRITVLSKIRKDPDYRIRIRVAEQIASGNSPEAIKSLEKFLYDEVWKVRQKVVGLIEKLSGNKILKSVARFYAKEKLTFSNTLKDIISKSKSVINLHCIQELLEEEEPEVKEQLIVNLMEVGNDACKELVLGKLFDPTASVRNAAIKNLRTVRDPNILVGALKLMLDIDGEVKRNALNYVNKYPINGFTRYILYKRLSRGEKLDKDLINFLIKIEKSERFLRKILFEVKDADPEDREIIMEAMKILYGDDYPVKAKLIIHGTTNEISGLAYDILDKTGSFKNSLAM